MADLSYIEELWLPIPGYEGWYEASSHGRIRSCARSTPTRNRWGPCLYNQPAKVIEGRLDRDGYRKMTLCVAGRVTRVFAHRLVALAFHGQPPEGKDQVAHGNGDKLDNRPANLRWADVKENARDKVRHGVTANQFGERHSHNKLTSEQVREIRSTPYWRGFDTHFAERFGVRPQAIGKVRRGERWRHLLEAHDGEKDSPDQ